MTDLTNKIKHLILEGIIKTFKIIQHQNLSTITDSQARSNFND